MQNIDFGRILSYQVFFAFFAARARLILQGLFQFLERPVLLLLRMLQLLQQPLFFCLEPMRPLVDVPYIFQELVFVPILTVLHLLDLVDQKRLPVLIRLQLL